MGRAGRCVSEGEAVLRCEGLAMRYDHFHLVLMVTHACNLPATTAIQAKSFLAPCRRKSAAWPFAALLLIERRRQP